MAGESATLLEHLVQVTVYDVVRSKNQPKKAALTGSASDVCSGQMRLGSGLPKKIESGRKASGWVA